MKNLGEKKTEYTNGRDESRIEGIFTKAEKNACFPDARISDE